MKRLHARWAHATYRTALAGNLALASRAWEKETREKKKKSNPPAPPARSTDPPTNDFMITGNNRQ